MPDKKISALTTASTLDGTEEIPANQLSATVKITLDEILVYIGANIAGGGGSGTFNLDCGTASAPASFTFDCGGA